MIIGDYLARLQKRGITLTGQDDRLIVDAPRGSLIEDDRDTMRQWKDEILMYLASRARSVPPPAGNCLPRVWEMVERLDDAGTSLGLPPICIQSLISHRLDRAAWAELGDASWWRLDHLRAVDEAEEWVYAKRREQAIEEEARALSDAAPLVQAVLVPAEAVS